MSHSPFTTTTRLPRARWASCPVISWRTSDAIDITIYGRGGHGAYPQSTVDPIVIAARTVVALQTIVARENNPLDPAVITVGSIHGGTKHNIIPDEVKLQLTVRSYKPEVREHLLAAIERIAKAESAAALAPKEPLVKVVESTKATYNDPALTERVGKVLRAALGDDNVLQPAPEMGAEDFSEFVGAGVPGVYLWVGAVAPARIEAGRQAGPRCRRLTPLSLRLTASRRYAPRCWRRRSRRWS